MRQLTLTQLINRLRATLTGQNIVDSFNSLMSIVLSLFSHCSENLVRISFAHSIVRAGDHVVSNIVASNSLSLDGDLDNFLQNLIENGPLPLSSDYANHVEDLKQIALASVIVLNKTLQVAATAHGHDWYIRKYKATSLAQATLNKQALYDSH